MPWFYSTAHNEAGLLGGGVQALAMGRVMLHRDCVTAVEIGDELIIAEVQPFCLRSLRSQVVGHHLIIIVFRLA